MLKLAYEAGVEIALEEEGITKEAFGKMLAEGLSKGISRAGGMIPGGTRAVSWGVRNPLAAKTLAGAGIGGLGGAAFGDEGGFARGAIMGAGLGAGAHMGKMVGLGKGGRGADKLLRDVVRGNAGGKLLNRRVALAQKVLGQRAGRGLAYGAGGAAVGGLGAGLLGQAVVPDGR